MDSGVENAINVHVSNQDTLKFKQCGNGLYYYDTLARAKSKEPVDNYSFLSTVAANKAHFITTEIQGAEDARVLQGRIGWPEDKHYKSIIISNQITDCKSTPDDIVTGNAIFGTLVPVLTGKMVSQKTRSKAEITRVTIPSPVLENHPTDSVSPDFFCRRKTLLVNEIQSI
jgi:hypothetical protein